MKFLLLSAFLVVGAAQALEPIAIVSSDASIPDVLIASRLDLSWSELLIDRLRRYVINLNLGDPFKGKVERELEVASIQARDVVSRSSQQLVSDVGGMLGIQVLGAHSRIRVKNIAYEVTRVTTDLRPLERGKDGQTFDGIFAAKGIRIGADEIRLIIDVPTTRGRALPVVEVVIKNPYIQTSAEQAVIAQAQVAIVEGSDSLSFRVLNSSFNTLADLLGRDPNLFTLGYGDIVIPSVSISVGNRRLTVEPDKVRAFVNSKQDQLKAMLVDLLRTQLRSGIAQTALDAVQQVKIPNEYWNDIDKMFLKLKFARISGSTGSRNVYLKMDSDFCTLDGHDRYGAECTQHKKTQPAPSVTTQAKLQSSMARMRQTLSNETANMVASFSEDYINKLIATTVDAGYFDERLQESGARLGPAGAFVRLEEAGKTGTLYTDILYHIGGVQALLVGGSEIRFPIVLKCGMRIERGPSGFPVVIFRVESALLTDEVLRRGVPDHGIPSTVERLKRFEGQVVKEIRKQVRLLVGQDILSLELPLFKGVGLESLEFLSDGLGRVNAHATLENLLIRGRNPTPTVPRR